MGRGRYATTEDDRRLIRELAREHNAGRRRLAEIDGQLLDLMDQRDALVAELERTSVRTLAEKFGVSKTHIIYVCRPRSSANVA